MNENILIKDQNKTNKDNEDVFVWDFLESYQREENKEEKTKEYFYGCLNLLKEMNMFYMKNRDCCPSYGKIYNFLKSNKNIFDYYKNLSENEINEIKKEYSEDVEEMKKITFEYTKRQNKNDVLRTKAQLCVLEILEKDFKEIFS